MNTRKICKMLGATTTMMSLLVLAGVVTNTPVYAAEKALFTECKTADKNNVLLNENKENNYTIDVNSSIEKQGFKLTIKNVTAAKHNIKVVALIESSKLVNYDNSSNNMLHMTVKNVGGETNGGFTNRKIDDNTVEYTFNIESSEGFNNSIQLRFDALLPQYDLNAWLETTVDISKYIDKYMEKDVQFSFGDNNFYKVESDILGTSIYYKQNERDDYSSVSNEDRTWDSQSQLLLKCNDKLYEVEDRNSYINHNEDTIEGYYRTDLLKIDDLDSKDDISIIPIKCNIKRSEIDSIIYAERDGQEDSEENNVKYKKEFKFLDNSKGVISKIERKDDKVKVYFSSASDKDGLLMALSMYGYYDYKEEDSNIHYNYEKIEKVIYKNPEEESGYVVEFDNVVKDKKFIVDADNIVFSYNDKFDMDEEIKIK